MSREEHIVIDEIGNTIPIKIRNENGEHIITIDGVEWVRTGNITHATILFNMMYEHITEYMTYQKIEITKKSNIEENIVKEDKIWVDETGKTVPVKIIKKNEEEYIIFIDGKEWYRTNTLIHAERLINIIKER